MAQNRSDRLQQAIALIQAGRPAEARPLLEALLAADPDYAPAWLWLAAASPNRDERIRFLERALALDPTSETARAAYERLTGTPYTGPRAALPPAAPAAGRAAITPGALLIVMAVVAVAVAAILVALYLRDRSSAAADTTPAATLFPLATLTPTSRFSPTPSTTPRPTDTPGPSPTWVWDAAVPTWTPAPSLTPAPTLRVATWTPRPPTATRTEPPPAPSDTPAPPVETAEAAGPDEEILPPAEGNN